MFVLPSPLLSLPSLQVQAKQMDNTPCGCALRCFDKISEEQRKKLFSGFWDTGDFNAYLCGCVKVVDIAKRTTPMGTASRCSHTRVFYVNSGQVSVRVCKIAFLRIHAVSNGRLSRALKSQSDSGGSPHNDRRGKYMPSNKNNDEDL